MLSPEDKLLIDRYLDNTLTGIELRDFLLRLDTDEIFKNEVSFHNKLIEGIIEAEDNRLTLAVMNATGYKKRLIPLTIKLIFTFLVITTGGIILWEYIGPGTISERQHYFSWNFIRNKNAQNTQSAQPQTAVVNHEQKKETVQTEELSADSTSVTDTIEDQNIVVKKDQLLISYQLHPIDLDVTGANSQTVSIEKSDAEGGSESKTSKTFEVEFWTSPINYKGYKLQGEKLVLFGIEIPDEVQLYILNENLWMKYGHNYFQLQQGENFESLVEAGVLPTELK